MKVLGIKVWGQLLEAKIGNLKGMMSKASYVTGKHGHCTLV